jgi:hypothetical protein
MMVASDPRYAEVEKQMQAAERERAEAIVELVGIYSGAGSRPDRRLNRRTEFGPIARGEAGSEDGWAW